MSEKSMRKHSGTDWDRLRATRDEDIAFDEDSPRTRPEDWEGAKITLHNRVLGSIPAGETEKPTPEPSPALRLPKDVLAYFKATGPGWQTRIEDVLKEWIKTHPLT
jgi:uncharacterized protein (DUF4415 family)